MWVKYLSIAILLSLSGCSSSPTKPPVVVDKSHHLGVVMPKSVVFKHVKQSAKNVEKNVKPTKIELPINLNSSLNWYFPVDSKIIQKFNNKHTGLSFDTHEGQTIHAVRSGKVVSVEAIKNQGITLIIRHPLGFNSVYQRIQYLAVELNDEVEKGQIIARTGNQLFYLEMQKFDKAIDPQKYLQSVNYD
jgi:murein DD-endopeptidase MepM/ murein hydrolase activator NlpD